MKQTIDFYAQLRQRDLLPHYAWMLWGWGIVLAIMCVWVGIEHYAAGHFAEQLKNNQVQYERLLQAKSQALFLQNQYRQKKAQIEQRSLAHVSRVIPKLIESYVPGTTLESFVYKNNQIQHYAGKAVKAGKVAELVKRLRQSAPDKTYRVDMQSFDQKTPVVEFKIEVYHE